MKHIPLYSMDHIYFTPLDDVSHLASLLSLELMWPNAFMAKHWNTVPDVRLVGVPWPRSNKLLMYWLYWDEATDLRELDARVDAGLHTDEDFDESVQTQYSKTICFSCNREWDTLIMPSDAYVGASGLFERKLQEWGPKLKKCPNCHGSLRQLVVKILGEHGRQ